VIKRLTPSHGGVESYVIVAASSISARDVMKRLGVSIESRVKEPHGRLASFKTRFIDLEESISTEHPNTEMRQI